MPENTDPPVPECFINLYIKASRFAQYRAIAMNHGGSRIVRICFDLAERELITATQEVKRLHHIDHI